MNLLTENTANTMLKVYLKQSTSIGYAYYNTFQIGSSSEKYKLTSTDFDSTKSTAPDSLSSEHNG